MYVDYLASDLVFERPDVFGSREKQRKDLLPTEKEDHEGGLTRVDHVLVTN